MVKTRSAQRAKQQKRKATNGEDYRQYQDDGHEEYGANRENVIEAAITWDDEDGEDDGGDVEVGTRLYKDCVENFIVSCMYS